MTSFAPATRHATKARVALCGPSGSGKTYTALALAHGLGRSIAVVDTERGSASKYVGLNGWEFDTSTPGSFSPDALTSLLGEAAGQYEVVVIDSLSHYWMGIDGMLEQVDKRSYGSNSFSGWKDARPLERRMVDALLAFPGHVVVTMRTKTEYIIEDIKGKKVPRKVGLKPEQRDGIEYEFDLVGDMDHSNTLSVSKSRIPSLTQAIIPEPGDALATTVVEWLADGSSVPDAYELRQRALAPDVTLDDLTELGARVSQLGIGKASVVDAAGNTVLLVGLIRDRWRELNAKTAEPAQEALISDA